QKPGPTITKTILLSVVIPVYNEGIAIQRLLGELDSYLCRESWEYELIIVDDGSTDQSIKSILLPAYATLVTLPGNQGNGSAVRAGIENARGEFVCVMDGDGQHDPKYVSGLLQLAKVHDLAVGARAAADHASLGRRIANAFYNGLASYAVSMRVIDL